MRALCTDIPLLVRLWAVPLGILPPQSSRWFPAICFWIVQGLVITVHLLQVTVGTVSYFDLRNHNYAAAYSFVCQFFYSLLPGLLATRIFHRRLSLSILLQHLWSDTRRANRICIFARVVMAITTACVIVLECLDFVVYYAPEKPSLLSSLGQAATLFVNVYNFVTAALVGIVLCIVTEGLHCHLNVVSDFVQAHGHPRGSQAVIAYVALVQDVAQALHPWLTAHFVLGALRITVLLVEDISAGFQHQSFLFLVDFWMYWILFVLLFLLPFVACMSVSKGWEAFLADLQDAVYADIEVAVSQSGATPFSLSKHEADLSLQQLHDPTCSFGAHLTHAATDSLMTATDDATRIRSFPRSRGGLTSHPPDASGSKPDVAQIVILFRGEQRVHLKVAGFYISRFSVSLLTIVSVVMYSFKIWNPFGLKSVG